MVTELRILNLIVWGGMLAYMLPGAVAAIRGTARYGDPMRLACALTAIVFIGFQVHWLFVPGREATLNGLLILSAALAVYILTLGRTYGRGQLLNRGNDDAR